MVWLPTLSPWVCTWSGWKTNAPALASMTRRNYGMANKIEISGYLIPVDQLRRVLREQGYHLISDTSLSMLTTAGYMSRYYENTTITTTYVNAWQLTEDEFRNVFNRPRFDSYESFRQSSKIKRYLKKK